MCVKIQVPCLVRSEKERYKNGKYLLFYLMMHFQEGNVLFNDKLNTFNLWLYGIGYIVTVHSDCKKGNPLLPHGLLFPISSKGSFICTIP